MRRHRDRICRAEDAHGKRPRPAPANGRVRSFPTSRTSPNERKAGLTGELLEVPLVAPDIVVEILSPFDRADRVASERDTYLAAGVRLVLIVDADSRAVYAYEATGCTTFSRGSISAIDNFPGFRIDIEALFAEID